MARGDVEEAGRVARLRDAHHVVDGAVLALPRHRTRASRAPASGAGSRRRARRRERSKRCPCGYDLRPSIAGWRIRTDRASGSAPGCCGSPRPYDRLELGVRVEPEHLERQRRGVSGTPPPQPCSHLVIGVGVHTDELDDLWNPFRTWPSECPQHFCDCVTAAPPRLPGNCRKPVRETPIRVLPPYRIMINCSSKGEHGSHFERAPPRVARGADERRSFSALAPMLARA